MKSPGLPVVSFLLVGAAVAVVAMPSGRACSNAVAEAEDDGVIALRAADKALDEGEPRRAFSLLRGAISDLEHQQPRAADDPASYPTNHALRIAALAAIRTSGDAGPASSNPANLLWARVTLETLARLHDAPMQRTDLAEARERTAPETAKAALEDLARQDLLVTPYGYGALARLRAEEGDVAGSDQATARCLQMATVATICDRPKADRSLRHRAFVWMRLHWELGLILGAIGAAAAWLSMRRRASTPAPRRVGSVAGE